MLERLCRGPATVSQLAAPLDMALPTVLKHLKVLDAGGFIRPEKVGRVRTVRISKGPLRATQRWITARQAAWERGLARLRAHLEQDRPKRG